MKNREGMRIDTTKILLVLDGDIIELDRYFIKPGHPSDPKDNSIVLTAFTKELNNG